MSNHTIFGDGEKPSRYDYNSSTGEKGSDSETMSRLSKEVISFNRRVHSTYRRLASTAIAVLPAPPQYQAMQLQQILELSVAGNYSSEIKLSDEGKTAMAGIESLLILSNGRSVIFYPPQLLIATKYAILTFTCLYPTARTIQIKIHIATLSFLVKMGGTPIQLLAQIR